MHYGFATTTPVVLSPCQLRELSMWGAIKWVMLLGTGLAVLVYVAGGFQPGKNAKGGLNLNNGQQGISNRFLQPNEVRNLFQTGRAPCRPEIDYQDSVSPLRELLRFAARVFECRRQQHLRRVLRRRQRCEPKLREIEIGRAHV